MTSLSRRHLLAAALAAAASPAVSQSARLRVIADAPDLYRSIHQAAIDAFVQGQPGASVAVQYTENYTQTLQQSLRDILVGDAPDLALHAHNNIALLAKRGVLAPLDDLMAESGLDLRTEIGRVDGRTFALPFTLSLPVVYFNLDLVRAAGGDPDRLPSTWADIVALGRRIEAPSGGVFYNYATDGSWTFMALIESLGGRILTEDGRGIAFDSPEGLEAMEILASVGEARRGQNLSAAQARQAFAAGTLGIHIDTTSRLRSFEQGASGRFKLATRPFPLKAGAAHRVPPSGGSIAIMAQDPARRKLAWEFVKVELSPAVQKAIYAATGFIPGVVAARRDPALLADFLGGNLNQEAILPSVAVLGPWPSFPVETPAVVDRAVRDALDRLATLKATPKETLALIVAAARA